jgi:blue light- and temperature-responsive anti-repressor
MASPFQPERAASPPPSPDPAFTFAFQPIVDTETRAIVGYEALLRGEWDEPAWQVLNQVPSPRLPLFDQTARAAAIALAARLGIDCALHLNFLPQSLASDPETLVSTLDTAQRVGLPLDRIVLEAAEAAVLEDRSSFPTLMKRVRDRGAHLAIENFGAAHASLTLLADLEPSRVKLDLRLIRGIDRHGPRQAVVSATARVCASLGIDLIAVVEAPDEYAWLREQNLRFFQGNLFARPAFEAFPPAQFPLTTLADLSTQRLHPIARPTPAARTKKPA